MTTTDVVIGTGPAGAGAAETLRESGASTDVVLIGDEPLAPYERPELSKGYLAGKTGREALDLHPAAWYAEHEITLQSGRRVTAVDRQAHEVVFDDGERLGYTRLLLATGSEPLPLRVPGAGQEGVHLLRRVGDSEAIRAAIGQGGPIVVVGGGWLGLEVTAVARSAGVDVTLLEAGPAPLARVLGRDVGAAFADLHRRHGVEVRTGVTVDHLTGHGGRVSGVVLGDGSELPAAAVVVAVGIRPRTELAEAAGLAVDDGVVVDARLRTADPAVWAAGDVASAVNEWAGRRLRVEHHANATDQGPFAGRSMAGSEQLWANPPFFWSDQYDVGLEYRGWADPRTARLVVRGTPWDGPWQAFWLTEDHRVAAAMHVDAWDEADVVKRFVTERVEVDPDALADPRIPLVS